MSVGALTIAAPKAINIPRGEKVGAYYRPDSN